MKLITFEAEASPARRPRAGALTSQGWAVDLELAARARSDAAGEDPSAGRLPSDLLDLLRGGSEALELARAALAFAEERSDLDIAPVSHAPGTFRLLAPLPRPPSLRDFLLVEDHVRNARHADPPEEWYRLPVYYKGNVDAVFGPEDEIPWPRYTERLDYEIEMCAVIGSTVRSVDISRALDHVVGYTIFNDWSARDIQRREMSVGLGPALGKDFANSLGPCIVTSDEFNPSSARMRARIDGEVWSEGDLSGMRFTFAEVIAWLSLEQTMQPGDLIGSGTISRGCGLELDRWIRPGSVVALEIDGIGILRNRVGARPSSAVVSAPPPPRGRW